MDHVEESFASPLRIRAKMGFLLWSLQLVAGGLFLLLDLLLRVSVFCLKSPISFIRRLFGIKSAPKSKPTEEELDLDRDFVEFVESRGFQAEEHIVTTSDGYLLTLHRILPKYKEGEKKRSTSSSSSSNVNTSTAYPDLYNSDEAGSFILPAGEGRSSYKGEKKDYYKVPSKGVIFFQHGFMQCSECWVFRKKTEYALPFILAELGYDCWFGNVRGNKYSMKHTSLSPTADPFWNYCIDDIALKDLPSMLTYVIDGTGSEKITYIGFSQGTAIAFAAFSRNAELANRIHIFIALAPAACVKELRNQLVAAVSTSRPHLVYLLFGKRALLSNALFWRRVGGTTRYVWILDTALLFLFGWKTENMDPKEKPLMYFHLYSTSSVKCVVQWFQITHSGRFQMYDDNVVVINKHSKYKGYLLPQYDISKIQCPISIFYGEKDTVPNHQFFFDKLGKIANFTKLETYEHLDFLYARNAHKEVYEDVVKLVNQYNPQASTRRNT